MRKSNLGNSLATVVVTGSAVLGDVLTDVTGVLVATEGAACRRVPGVAVGTRGVGCESDRVRGEAAVDGRYEGVSM